MLLASKLVQVPSVDSLELIRVEDAIFAWKLQFEARRLDSVNVGVNVAKEDDDAQPQVLFLFLQT